MTTDLNRSKKQKETKATHNTNFIAVSSQANNLEVVVQKSDDHFVLFFDPESRLYYRFYFSHSYQYIKVE